MLTRNTKPMKRGAFPKWLPKEATQSTSIARAKPIAIPRGDARMVVAVPKEVPIQSEAYMRAVRKLPCARCGIQGYTQFCHADEGKGMGIKTDCRLGWPGCGPHDGQPGCHAIVGSTGQLGKKGRREFEERAGRETRAAIRAAGTWPARLAGWAEDEDTAFNGR